MSLIPLKAKLRIKRAARQLGMLQILNRLEYSYGNRITRAALAFYRPLIPANSLCFDIGAHYGGKARLFRQLGARVIAVEPLKECLAVLEQRFAKDDKVTLIRGACGERARKARLYLSLLNPQNSTLSSEFVASLGTDPEWEDSEEVELVTLDALIERYGLPAFCKIDTEGYELDVLRGLGVPIATLSFEFRSEDYAITAKCVERLGALGYGSFNYIYEPREVFVANDWLSREQLLEQLRHAQRGMCGHVFAQCLPSARNAS